MTKKTNLKVGDPVLDTHINMTATIVKFFDGGICRITYDQPPPVEYNMGSLDGLQFIDKLELIGKK